MSKEMPEWYTKLPQFYKDFVESNIDENDMPMLDRRVAAACYHFLSKPENLAKIPEVKELSEELKKFVKQYPAISVSELDYMLTILKKWE